MAWSVAKDLLIESYFHRNPRIVLGYFITQKSPESQLCWLNLYLGANPLNNTNNRPCSLLFRQLRPERGDEPKITMVRVSSALQFFVLAFAHGPFELWDAARLCLLRTMPKKFPHVSAITWSPIMQHRDGVFVIKFYQGYESYLRGRDGSPNPQSA